MTELGEAFVPIRATLDKLDGDLAGAKSKIEKALGGLGEGLKTVGNVALGLGAAGFTALAAGIGLALNEAMDAQAIMAQTEAVIKSTGGAAGLSAEQIGEMATALSTQSRFSDDAIQSGENLLLTFTNIGAETFPAATQAMVDMAAAMGTDVSGGAIQLGKALNDPVAGISALTRVGVTFTEEQKKVIKAMVAAGDTAGAQAVILAELNKEFGGSAAAAAETFAGKLDVVKNQLLNVAEGIGMVLLPIGTELIDRFLTPAIPIIQAVADAIGSFVEGLASGEDPAGDFANLAWEISTALGATKEQATAVFTSVRDLADGFMDLVAQLTALADQVKPYLQTAAEWLAQNVALQDVLIALGVAIAAVVIPAIASVVAAAAPVVLAFVGVIAVAALLRHAWEENWGGIQEKTAAVWAQVQPLLAQAQEWLQVNIPIALEALRAFWVDTAWPAIQRAVEVIWPVVVTVFNAIRDFIVNTLIPAVADLYTKWTTIWWPQIQAALQQAWADIQPILLAIKDFVLNTLIPAVLDLYTKWTTEWWPAISTALTNAWAIIETVFKELDRWINKNIVPWIEFLQKKWAEEVWPAISAALDAAWVIIKPIWEAFEEWMAEKIPTATAGLQTAFETAMTAIDRAVQPVKTLWDAFTKAVSDFWSWITSHTFSFSLSIPDLPDWAVPGSPLPIHTAWKNFANEMNRLTVAPKFDLDALMPVMGLVGEDAGPAQSVSYSSVTHVNTNRDPMRVLRASRHLDKLGAMA